MSDRSKIEWCDATWNPWWGCTPVSEGCEHCYAARFASRAIVACDPELAANGEWTGNVVSLDGWIERPTLHWKKPRRIFVCSMSDFFYERVPIEWCEQAWQVMQNCPQHRFLILTKRPQNIAEMLPADWGQGYTNVWLGVSAETDARGRERIPVLLDIAVHAGQRFVSYEPALGPLDFSSLCRRGDLSQSVRWVIAGGENGPGARPAHVQWFRRLRDACKLHGVPFFFKGWGAYVHAGQLPYLLPGVVKRPKGAGAMTWPDGSVSFRWKRPLLSEFLDGMKYERFPDERAGFQGRAHA